MEEVGLSLDHCHGYNQMMAYIETISESAAEGQLAELYRRFANSDGSVDNVLKVHSLNPAALLAHSQLYMQAMHAPSPVSRLEREVIAIGVSRLNGCGYCLAHHAAGLRRLSPPENAVDQRFSSRRIPPTIVLKAIASRFGAGLQ